jgi:hypothetical protein
MFFRMLKFYRTFAELGENAKRAWDYRRRRVDQSW